MRLFIILILLSQCLVAEARWNGKIYFYGELAGLTEWDYSQSNLMTLNTGVEYIGNPLKSFGCEVNVYQYIEPGLNTTGFGIRPMTKYYLWRTNRFRLFVEIKGGVIYLLKEYPEDGSQFNFTFSGSVGSDFRLTDRTKLLVTARYSHMSNWNIYGEAYNPTWDGLGAAAGIIWQMR